MATLSVAGLHVYPVKSCAGIARSRVRVLPRGLQHDRAFMIVRADSGAFVTQREHPELAAVRTTLAEGTLVLTTRTAEVELPADPARAAVGGERRRVRVWDDDVEASIVSSASALVSEVLGFEALLVVMPPDVLRPVDPTFARAGDHVSFADGFPVLLATTASLDDLGAHLERAGEPPVPMSRFRPNVVVTGGAAWDEERHGRVRIGSVVFRMPKRCARCQVVTVDQTTGTSTGKEPLRTLATFRRDGAAVHFGLNLVPEELSPDAHVAVGDEVEWLDPLP